jgi:NAD-dependent dihydropyrimidine dehydrogenase PreA subunit
MKGMIMGLFTIFEKSDVKLNENSESIQLENCPQGGFLCVEQLSLINKKMSNSRQYWTNKEFAQAIEELKIAYRKTYEINHSTCIQCADLFRATIRKSMEAIQKDLQDMTSGIFKANRYKPSLELVSTALKEITEEI